MSLRTPLSALALVAALTAPVSGQQKVELPARDRAITLQTRDLFRVGAVEGADHETFANVMDVAFDAKGNLYVLDATAFRIVVFDAAGRFVRMIGRQGGGPGEFGLPTALAILPSGELVVNDAMKGSLQMFSPAGEYLRSVSLGEDLGRAVGRMRPGGGGVVTETMSRRRVSEGAARGNLERIQLPARSVTWLAFGDTVAARRLFNAPPREAKLNAPQRANGAVVRMSMSTAFEPSLLWTPLPAGGIAASHSEHYRIAIVDANGRPLRYLERPIEPKKVTDADRKQFMENRKNGVGMGAIGGAAVVAFSSSAGGSARTGPPASGVMRMDASDLKESDITWNDVIPVVRALGADAFGRLWIQRTAPDQGEGAIDLVDSGLRYLGTLSAQPMPRAFGPDGRVAYIERDELDVQRVVVKQLLK